MSSSSTLGKCRIATCPNKAVPELTGDDVCIRHRKESPKYYEILVGQLSPEDKLTADNKVFLNVTDSQIDWKLHSTLFGYKYPKELIDELAKHSEYIERFSDNYHQKYFRVVVVQILKRLRFYDGDPENFIEYLASKGIYIDSLKTQFDMILPQHRHFFHKYTENAIKKAKRVPYFKTLYPSDLYYYLSDRPDLVLQLMFHGLEFEYYSLINYGDPQIGMWNRILEYLYNNWELLPRFINAPRPKGIVGYLNFNNQRVEPLITFVAFKAFHNPNEIYKLEQVLQLGAITDVQTNEGSYFHLFHRMVGKIIKKTPSLRDMYKNLFISSCLNLSDTITSNKGKTLRKAARLFNLEQEIRSDSFFTLKRLSLRTIRTNQIDVSGIPNVIEF